MNDISITHSEWARIPAGKGGDSRAEDIGGAYDILSQADIRNQAVEGMDRWIHRGLHDSGFVGRSALSMARYRAAKKFRNVDVRSGRKATSYVASTKTVALELAHLTLTSFKYESKRYDLVLSNWTPLTEALFSEIHEYEAPEWGHRKVPTIC